ncbi:hypothetical protein OS493_017802 [Desmophyllum pertusum]|uniref:Uncharacterized protein n=1 Tax=Desmophyllum pertusum TaxID=174260 RepID=A0A9X0CZK8_9CNID|nr:hypothetical protein OS493_017802 [Desmophyllum pertusum]
MERNNKVGFKNDATAGSKNNARIVLPRIEGTKRNFSLTGSETYSLITSASGTLSPDMDSDLEDMALQEEEEEEEEDEDEGKGGKDEHKQHDKDENDKQLSMTSEKEIRQRARGVLKKELKRIRVEAAAKKNDTPEKVSIDKLEERAGIQQARIIQERAQRKKEEKGKDSEYDKMNGKAKVANLLQHEVKRLERAEEVQKILVELHSLGLSEAAINLTHALRGKEDSESEFRAQLQDDQIKAKKRASMLVESEIKKVRKECLAEMERKEREKAEKERLEKEREERERREREMAMLKKMARDMAMKKMYKESMFNTSVSRPFSFSYFPSLKK